MISKINYGVIGCSRIAYSSTIPAILKSNNSELTMIGSRNVNRSKEYAKKFKCKSYGTYEDVLDNKNIQAIYISTPVGVHEEFVVKALKKGKHVICEKSIGSSFSSIKRMIRVASKNKLRLMEGLMFKFHPSHQIVKDIIKRKILGEIYGFYGEYGFPKIPLSDIRYNKKLGGGILNDAACYPIAASRMILEKEPLFVFSNKQNHHLKNIDERISINLIFEKNMISQIKCGYNLNYSNFYSIWGNKGSLNLTRSYNIPPKMSPKILLSMGKSRKKIKINPADHFELMFNNFSNEILGKNGKKYGFEQEIINQGKIMEAVRLSARKEKIIDVLSIK